MNIAYSISICVMEFRQGLEEIVKEMALICNLQENSMFTTSMGYWGRSHVKGKRRRNGERKETWKRGRKEQKELDRETEANSKQQQDDMTKSWDSWCTATNQGNSECKSRLSGTLNKTEKFSSQTNTWNKKEDLVNKSTETWISTKALTNSTNQWTHCAYKFCNWEEMIISFWKIWTAKIHLRKVQWTYKENKPAVRNHSKTGSTTLCWALSKCSETFTCTQNKVPPKDNLS